jgi:hypothetical protein
MREDIFIRKLEHYLGEDFTPFTKNRIKGFLAEYKDDIPPVVVKVAKEPSEITKYKKQITTDILIDNAKMLCRLHGISLEKFLKTPEKRSANHKVTQMRKQFCKDTLESYLCNSSILANFFGVHHTTISYYLYERKKNKIITRNMCKI